MNRLPFILTMTAIALVVGALIALSAVKAEPPTFAGVDAQGQCPKGWVKRRGECWRRVVDDGMGPSGFIDEAFLEDLVADKTAFKRLPESKRDK